MEDRVIQHVEQVLAIARLMVNTAAHDGFVLVGTAIQSEEPDEDERSRALPMGSESFVTDFLQNKLKRARSLCQKLEEAARL